MEIEQVRVREREYEIKGGWRMERKWEGVNEDRGGAIE